MNSPRRPESDISGTHSELPVAGFECPLPLRDHPHIVMGHGSGGRMSADLIRHLFLPAFHADSDCEPLLDSAVLPSPGRRLALTSDSFVVRPLFFPGGSIGELAVNGTVNDLAMSGAIPLYLTASFILEEGFSLATLAEIAQRMGRAARIAGVSIVAGDTKVVEHGCADGCYITTSGIGSIPDGIEISPIRIQAGDVILVSGTIGDHGMAVMSVREGLEFESQIVSDTAALHELVSCMLNVCPGIRMLRDPTRGGLAASMHEIAAASACGIVLQESQIPVNPSVQAACELLGLDPLHVANEGKLVAFVPAHAADAVLKAMHAHPLGSNARVIGQSTAEHAGRVTVATAFGTNRILTLPLSEQLPRIC
ncbi:MAG: hydrogenase expression/formation protein HypE [Planctomycetaceae bacterium]|nr:hydrogenase expression/formation protein HypE [Planctomycetaceae bacterium]